MVMPPHAARSNDISPVLSTSFMPAILPFLRIANSIVTLPFFISGARADAGIRLYQLSA